MALVSGAMVACVPDPADNLEGMAQAVRVEALTLLKLCQELPV